MTEQEKFQRELVLEAFATVGRLVGEIALSLASKPEQLVIPPSKDELLNRKQAAEFLGMSTATFDRLRPLDAFGEHLVGGRPKFSKRKLQQYDNSLK